MRRCSIPTSLTIHAFDFGLEAPNATSFPESTNYLTWSTSTDDGVTWSVPVVAMDGPGWGAGGGAHGVELQHGPHRGRLALPYPRGIDMRRTRS